MDALGMDDLKNCEYSSQNPGFCHACGHDGHTATLLAAARILKSMENDFAGEVRFFFQQAEEIGQGGTSIRRGRFAPRGRSHLRAACHQHAQRRPSRYRCRTSQRKLRLFPHRSEGQRSSRLHAAQRRGCSLRGFPDRGSRAEHRCAQHRSDGVCVVGIGKAWAGTQYNIVAEEAVLEGTVRTFLPKYVKLTIGGLRTSSKKQPRCSAPTQASSSRTIPTP